MNSQVIPERSIDRTLARWVRERSGSELVARAAYAVSMAEGQGHACAALASDPLFDDALIAQLRAHAWIGDGSGFTPFVLDDDAKLYTWRNWYHETRLADGLLRRARARALPVDAKELSTDIAELFAGDDALATRWQRVAVAAVPGARLFVLTGGPGTGKTTTVLRMLLELLRRAPKSGLPVQPKIALAAPTGKAAQRLSQAIANGKQKLLQTLAPQSALRELIDSIPHAQAQTLHRLLGFRPREDGFAYGATNPLAADIVVVDEASMVDLAMMRQLVDAMRDDAILILLGDPAQLAAVEAGSVLGDIVASVGVNTVPAELVQRLVPAVEPPPDTDTNPAPLCGQVVTLTHGWRAGSGLQRGIDALRAVDATWLDTFVANGSDGSLHLHACANAAALRVRVDAWIEAHAELFGSLFAAEALPHVALQSLRNAQILCALREGAFGAQGVNAMVASRLVLRFGVDAGTQWYSGRAVIVTRNDYSRQLFNGDIGIAMEGAEGLRVWFEVGHADGSVGLRSFSPRALPAHETAWAITIHRSQGSEYADVAVVLPPDPEQRILSRELLYTGVSRATHSAEIWTTSAALLAAANRPIQRHGGLRKRLASPA